MLYAYLAAVALVLFVLGVAKEPRRVSNAVWLGTAALFALLELVVRAHEAPWLKTVLGVAFVVVAMILPVALIANGVVMWRREGHRLRNLLSLLAGAGLAATAVLSLATGPSTNPWLNAPVGSVVFVVAYAAFLFGCFLLYSLVYGRLRRRRGFAAIIVLGAGLANGQVPPLLAARLDRAIRIFRQERHGPLIVVSGGRGPDETRTEADAMREYLVDRGIPADKILTEAEATTTEENLRLATALLPANRRPLVAVTSNYHVFRTAVTARRLGLRLDVAGAPTARYFLPSAFLREFAALVAHYRLTNIAAAGLLALIPWAMLLD
ncbi:YdcF family protein [Amycolatopsis dongchuanensis]|uniref:YdcF family protein n=1 Tax=Amycolatopsis dongchuanensis TaxID=1070866 RepID=A0ABP9PT15_9PSEU